MTPSKCHIYHEWDVSSLPCTMVAPWKSNKMYQSNEFITPSPRFLTLYILHNYNGNCLVTKNYLFCFVVPVNDNCLCALFLAIEHVRCYQNRFICNCSLFNVNSKNNDTQSAWRLVSSFRHLWITLETQQSQPCTGTIECFTPTRCYYKICVMIDRSQSFLNVMLSQTRCCTTAVS